MKYLLLPVIIFLVAMIAPPNFKDEQLKFQRVREANAEKKAFLEELLKNNNLKTSELQIFVRAFKQEQIMEVWAKNRGEVNYRKLIEYPFCTTSGDLGPKRKQGDYQIPEGFYHIDRFNPYSNFHLSLGVNYPNSSDKILSDRKSPGGDIFLHGNCVSIGCIPITDDKIKELYLLAVEAKNSGQSQIPVHIFPAKLDHGTIEKLTQDPDFKYFESFWQNLKEGYDYFEKNKKLPKVTVDAKGKYLFGK